MFRLWHKWLGPQWSIGDFAGMQAAMATEIPGWMLAALQRMAPAGTGGPASAPPQELREYDPEWGDAFASGRATATCDHGCKGRAAHALTNLPGPLGRCGVGAREGLQRRGERRHRSASVSGGLCGTR